MISNKWLQVSDGKNSQYAGSNITFQVLKHFFFHFFKEQNMEENDQNDPDYFYDDEDMKYEDTEDDLLLSQKIVRRRIKDNPENRYFQVHVGETSKNFPFFN